MIKVTQTTICVNEDHRNEPPGVRKLDFWESYEQLADYLAGYNIREEGLCAGRWENLTPVRFEGEANRS